MSQCFVKVLTIFVMSIGCVMAQDGGSNSQSSGHRVALVIGNATYKGAPLKNPINDAKDMATKLRVLDFDVVMRTNLTSKQIGSALREFKAKLTPGSVALFFYAGHGVQIKGENYFPAVDSDIGGEEDVANQSLSTRQIMSVLDDAKTRLNLVFLDACRDNPFSRSFRSASGGLAKVDAPSGTLISFATRPGSVAADGNGKNGLYTENLLKVMDLPGIPVEQALKQVVANVKRSSGGKQEPWMEGSIEGDFYFVKPPVLPAATQQTRLPVQAIASDPDTALWTEVKSNGSREYFSAYIAQFPKGKYAALATLELKRSNAAKQQPFNDNKVVGAVQLVAQSTASTNMSASDRYSTVGSYPITDCVKDKSTGLTWEGKPLSGERASDKEYTNYGDRRTGDASYYVDTVNTMQLCGYSDWRLPTKDDLVGLNGAGFPSTIDGTWFPNTQARWHWSASVNARFPTFTWVVNFYDGDVNGYGLRSESSQVRLVR